MTEAIVNKIRATYRAEETSQETFDLVLAIRKKVLQPNFSVDALQKQLSTLLEQLGFQSLQKQATPQSATTWQP